MNEKIGIIIPSYNQGKYLERTILSVLENARNANIEIALIDGGSTDNSVEIIQKYKDSFTAWCSETDRGQADAINKGIIRLPDCKYYMWLNSDDIFEDDMSVKKIADFAEREKYEVCYGLSHFIDENGHVIGEYPVESYSYKKLGNRCFLSQPSVLFSKKAFDAVGPLAQELKMCLDYEYWMRLAQKFDFGFIREYIGCTRMHGETKTSTMQEKHLCEAIVLLQHYYGRVPMRWIVSKMLTDYPSALWTRFPKRLLMLLLLPARKNVIEKCMKGYNNVKNTL